MLHPPQTGSSGPVVQPGARDTEAERIEIEAQLKARQRQTLLKLSQFLWLGFGILEALIGLRILLKLMAANPQSPFAQLVYAVTQPFLAPFAGLTATPAANGIVLEVSSIFALFVYALLSILVERLIWILFSRPRV
jgi:YggT family protein